ncbi:hypothetical protein CLAIMM_02390 [Cladophialophora immunda]|nr:hypothetical protein CLAIMM_02390 [Cladophialophora immunda]
MASVITPLHTDMDSNIEKERKALADEIGRVRKFYKGTGADDELYLRFLAAHNKRLNLLSTGGRRRIQARFPGLSIEQAMQGELLRGSVGTALGMLHVMVWYAAAATDEEHQLRRLYVWAYLRRYGLVLAGLGVLSRFSLRLSHQPLEDSQRQWDEAVDFYAWCEGEAPKYRPKEDLQADPAAAAGEKRRLVARLRGLRLPKPKLSKLFRNRDN